MSISRSPSPEKRRETLPLATEGRSTYGTDGSGRTYHSNSANNVPGGGEQMVTVPAALLQQMIALAAKNSAVPEQEATINLSDGSQYVGAVHDGKPHGKGTLNFKPNQWNYQRFDGVFQAGAMRQGKMIYTHGGRYEGEFENDRPHGMGQYSFANGDFYEGQFTQGQITGRGRYKLVEGKTYEGMVVNNNFHGQGVLRWANGDVHTGNFANGSAEGPGIQTTVGSIGISTLEGNFHKGKLWNGILKAGNGHKAVYHQGKSVFYGFVNSYEEWARHQNFGPGGTYHDECMCTLI